MKHNSHLEISIPVPCHENWNNMSSTEKGKFCSKCKKEVLDFTTVSKSDFQKIVSERNENICGRFLKSQLKVSKIEKKKSPLLKFIFLRKIAASLFSIIGIKILTASSASAQIIELNNPNESDMKKAGIVQQVNTDDSLILIKGIIKDKKSKETISFSVITVSIDGKQIAGVVGDIDGNFELKILKQHLNKDFDIRINNVGYENLVVNNIPVSNLNFFIQIELQQRSFEDLNMVGLIMVEPIIVPGENPNEKTFNQKDIKRLPH